MSFDACFDGTTAHVRIAPPIVPIPQAVTPTIVGHGPRSPQRASARRFRAAASSSRTSARAFATSCRSYSPCRARTARSAPSSGAAPAADGAVVPRNLYARADRRGARRAQRLLGAARAHRRDRQSRVPQAQGGDRDRARARAAFTERRLLLGRVHGRRHGHECVSSSGARRRASCAPPIRSCSATRGTTGARTTTTTRTSWRAASQDGVFASHPLATPENGNDRRSQRVASPSARGATARAIALLPFMNTVVIPSALLLLLAAAHARALSPR